MKTFVRVSAVAAAMLLTGCTTTYVSPVEVTRFTGSQPQALGSGPIAVRAGVGAPGDSLELSVFREAVAKKLHELGYVIIDGDAPQVAEVTVDQMVEQPGYNHSPVSGGVGVGGGSYGSSAGVGIGIDLSPRPTERVHRELRVMIKPADGGTALWEGRARFAASANSAYADTQAAATKLADALFGGFPGQSGETIEVK
jgi:hypothetical protein